MPNQHPFILDAKSAPLRTAGLILAGGRAQRMGEQDKGLIAFRGQALIAHALARLKPQVDEVLISANRNLQAYQGFGVAVVSDLTPDFAGPLAGLEAGLAHAHTLWVATVPCDAPFLPLDLVDRLCQAATSADAEIAVASCTKRLQPAFTLTKRELRPALRTFLAGGGRKIESWLKTRHTVEVNFDDETAFTNLNSPDDLRLWEQLKR